MTWRASIRPPPRRSPLPRVTAPARASSTSRASSVTMIERCADDLGDADAVGGDDGDARQVAVALRGGRLVAGDDDQGRQSCRPTWRAPRPPCLVAGSSKRAGRQDRDRVAVGVDAERRAQRLAARLAVDLEDVVARLGARTRCRRRGGGGTLSAPTRARPVPFCRHALAPVIATSPRVRLEWVPWRRAFRSARAASWTSDSLKGSLKTASGRSLLACLPIVLDLGT